MPAEQLRPSERTARESDRHGNNAAEHLGHAMNEVLAALSSRGNSVVQGTTERTHDVLEARRRLGRQIEDWGQDRVRDAQRIANDTAEAAGRIGTQASNIPGDTVVRARRELRRATEGVSEGLDARERQLYPEENRSRDRVVRQPQPAREAGARPADATAAARQPERTAARPQDASHDYEVRRGDTISSIVRANEERLHPGVRDRQREALIVRRLVSRNGGETILPGMHLDLG